MSKQKKLNPVRGTHDLLGDDCRQFRAIVDTARRTASTYGFSEAMTPIFEFSEVFHRTLGDTSDVVSKETYTFTDRGGESLTLRPECTASIVRSFISNGLQDQLPCKFFYAGPAFRYERPQKGRQRQFHQLGVELLGASEVQADIETIALAAQILNALGLSSYVKLELNSLGDSESRTNYRQALVDYLSTHKAALSEDSQTRLERNPLRILDSKAEQDQAIIADAPRLAEHFTDEAKQFFDDLQAGLTQLGIAFTLNDRLVRGLDYYNHTVFEFTTDALGSQNAVLAGGRYDGLVELMGGADVPGIGFAAGIERLMALLEVAGNPLQAKQPPIIAIIPMGEAAEKEALSIAHRLRSNGLSIEHAYRGNMGKRLKKADKIGASLAIILGEDELAKGEATLRSLKDGTQQAVALPALEDAINNQLKSKS